MSTAPRSIAVVIPVLNEEGVIAEALESAAGADEILVVDGGSTDRTVEVALGCGARVVESARGRGVQQNVGGRLATSDVLLFLHADSLLPAGYRDDVLRALNRSAAGWGRFDVELRPAGPLLGLIGRLISVRSRISRGATGDQGIFVLRGLFNRIGGFAEQSLFEDVEICRRLKREAVMAIPHGRMITSSRRWRSDGVFRTVLLMWAMKLAYLSGVPAERLERFYRNAR
jgi:rSAM/selenodomain-associated transferase 2